MTQCKEFRQWALLGQVTHLSLMYASGNFSSPASFFGHTFLKLGIVETARQEVLADAAIDYYAMIPPNEWGLGYITKATAGGYRGRYRRDSLFFLLNSYGEKEQRDVWEYRLALSPSEIALVLGHAYEMRSVQFDYYYAKQNCAYRLAELLDVVIDTPIVSPSDGWLIPADILDRVARATHHGKPLVADVTLHPSRRSRFLTGTSSLSKDTRQHLSDIASRKVPIAEINKLGISSQEKARLADVLLDYYEYIAPQISTTEYEQRRRQTLGLRFSLPVASYELPAEPPRPAPHLGQAAAMMQFSILAGPGRKPAAELRLRPVYFDELSDPIGRQPFSAFSMLDLTLTSANGRLGLERLDLLSVSNIRPPTTDLPYERQLSWEFDLGLHRRTSNCSDCLVGEVAARWGHAVGMGDDAALFLLIGPVFAYDPPLLALALESVIGLTGSLGRGVRASARNIRRWAGGSVTGPKHRTEIEVAFSKNRVWDIRFGVRYDVSAVWRIGVSRFW